MSQISNVFYALLKNSLTFNKMHVAFSTGLSTGVSYDTLYGTCDFSHKNIFKNVRFITILDLILSVKNDRLEA